MIDLGKWVLLLVSQVYELRNFHRLIRLLLPILAVPACPFLTLLSNREAMRRTCYV